MNPLALLMGSFFLLVFLKVPIVFVFVISSVITIIYMGMPLMSVINHIYSSIDSFPLLAVPFFLLLGQLLNHGRITERLIEFSDSVVGHIKGGLGHVNVLVSMLFAGLSGSSVADTAGVGAVMIPAMKKAKFDAPFSAAITACSSTLGGIIPPSIIMVVYASLAQLSVGAMFLSGFVPGILIGFSQMGYTYYLAGKKGYPAGRRKDLKDMGKAFVKAFLPLLMPLIIIGGVLAGIFTATEAAVIAVAYGMILIYAVYRSARLRDLPKVLGTAVIGYSLPMMAVASAGIMGWLIAYLDAPDIVLRLIFNITVEPFGIALLIVAFLLILGTFLSPIICIIVFLPILQALGQAAGLDPLHLGIIVVLTLSLGRVTPPYGICLLVASQIAEIPSHKVFKASLPMIALTLLIIVAGIVVPDLFLILPRLLMPQYL